MEDKVAEKLVQIVRSCQWFCWQPGWDTLIAVVTILYMIPSYYWLSPPQHPAAYFNFIFVSVVINVLLLAWYILKVRKEPSTELGLTQRHWLISLLISIALVCIFMPRFLEVLATIPSEYALPSALFCALCLWEPFFIYCWLQLRFERAFGVIPGIILAGVCMGLYHVGTYPLLGMPGVVQLMLHGIFFGAIFRSTKNLLVLWPLTWAISASIGTISGGFIFEWEVVGMYAVILLIQAVGLWWLSRAKPTSPNTA